MRFFGFGRRRAASGPEQPVAPPGQAANPSAVPAVREIVVYGTTEGSRCRQVRALLERRGYPYKDVRVDEDLSTRSWLQRTTGDDALPKVFVGAKCYGGLEDIQVLVFDGTFDRILQGETDAHGQDDELSALKKEMSAAAIVTLLRKGETLTIREGDMEMDAWAEPFANPPLIYYEGTAHPIAAMDHIVAQILARHKAGEIAVNWKEDD